MAADRAVILRQLLTKITQVQKMIDASQQVIFRNVVFETETEKQLPLNPGLLSDYGVTL